MKILDEVNQELIGRKRIILVEEHSGGTPSEADIKKQVASQAKSEEGNIAIQSIKTKYGGGSSEIIAHIYEDPKNLKKFEEFNKKKKDDKKEEAKPEVKKEPKKEEVKVEDKQEKQEKDGGQEGKEEQKS